MALHVGSEALLPFCDCPKFVFYQICLCHCYHSSDLAEGSVGMCVGRGGYSL